MIKSSEVLRSYVQALRALVSARAVSLFVPAARGFSNAILISEGGEGAPELATLAEAEGFYRGFVGEARRGAWQFPSVSPDCRLIQVPSHWVLTEFAERAGERPHGRRVADLEAPAPLTPPVGLLGLRFDGGTPFMPSAAEPVPLNLAWASPEEVQRGGWTWLLALTSALAAYTQQVSTMLDDPVTGLPGRTEFVASLDHALSQARTTGRALTLMLVSPDEFASINERFGREAGDEVMREVARRLRAGQRASDPLSKYGGAIFASVLVDTRLPGGRSVAQKIVRALGEGAFLAGAVRLGFSAGLASYEPGEPEVDSWVDLVRRADQALFAAKRAGGNQVVGWEEAAAAEEVGNQDRLSGIFTGSMAKDYRNMVLLWDTVSAMAATSDFGDLAREVVQRLNTTLKPARVGIFGGRSGPVRLIHGLLRREDGAVVDLADHPQDVREDEDELVRQATLERRPLKAVMPALSQGGEAVQTAVIPLVADEGVQGYLLLSGPASEVGLDSSDLIFLRALASQLAVAQDRSHLSRQEKLRAERERRQLDAEIDDLRRALQEAKLLYKSPQMEAVLAAARRVAPTDATVLVTGESGTGKELLARTIHEVSPRRKKPLVVVDCGAIPPTLIESELFGHEKGAYTGAAQRRIGRLAEAEGGTVLLDEIGELPLEMQAKLLRFVQEKQITPIGSSQARLVDARLIAATNRDLGAEVAAGRFRQDLYYRLNVIRLVLPPLRDRPDDILSLAHHFLETYAALYHKPVRGLSAQAEGLLLRFSWPGNVRELQNRMMQAVILCEGHELGPGDLALPSLLVEAPAAPGEAHPRAEVSAPRGPAPPPAANGWDRLEASLVAQVEEAMERGLARAFPLGRWLSDDLVAEAHAAAGGVPRRGAALVGIPESTFRRRLQRVSQQATAGLSTRSPSWVAVRRALTDVVSLPDPVGQDRIERAERLLLRALVARLPDDVRFGAALLGVTATTFARRFEALSRQT